MKTEIIKFLEDEEIRADSFIASNLNVSRSSVAKLIEDGNVLINGKAISKSKPLKYGDLLEVSIPEPVPLEITPWDVPLDIIYEDDDLLVVNKPKGMVVHPAPGHYEQTLCHALMHHCKDNLSGINGVLRPGIVHRIDKDTSGLLIVAKNDNAHNHLAEQIKEHSFFREYIAVCHGVFKETNGTIELPIGRHPVKRKQMAVTDKNSKYAKTEYIVEKQFKNLALVRFRLYTGRTHQIRVHSSYIGHAVAGDEVYAPNKKTFGLSGQCLHAQKIGFIHPVTNEYLEFSSSLPEYFSEFLKRCENL